MTLAFVLVVGGRFLLPLLIPRYPLPAILACLVLDGVDQTIFQSFGYDSPGYQGYDKAMDVYCFAVAYLATLRDWTSTPGFAVGRILYFYRLVGVVAFELSHARPLLLVFPNTLEYFFIAYEGIRTRWNPLRLGLRGWVVVAALIWVFVKLPQEWWIHIAQLDVTDVLADHAWAPWLLLGLVLAVLVAAWYIALPRAPRPDWLPRVVADPLPTEIDEAHEVAAWQVAHSRVWSWPTLEKVVLVALLWVVFAQTLPVRSSDLELAVSTGVLVVANAAITLAAARLGVSFVSLAVTFGVRILINVVLVGLASWVLGTTAIDEGASIFFLFLLSLLTTLHDRWLPVREYRVRQEPALDDPPRLVNTNG